MSEHDRHLNRNEDAECPWCRLEDLLNALIVLADAAEARGIPVDAARAAIARAEGRSDE